MPTSIVVALIVLSISTVDAAVTGRVTDEEGNPLAGIVVEAFRAESSDEFTSRIVSDRPDSVPLAITKTATDGSFSADTGDATAVALLVDRRVVRRAVDGIDAGVITLPPARSITGRITAAGKPVSGAVIVLDRFLVIRSDSEGRYEAPQTLAEGMTVFHRDFAIRDREFSMRGATHDIELRRSEPVSGRVVAVDGKTAAANAIIYMNEWPLARSGEDGAFTITNAPAGWTKLSARLGNDVGAINRSSKPPHILRLRRGATVRGVVRDAKSHLPLHGALIPLHEPAGRNSRYVVSDRKGNYEITAVTPGEGQLAASRPGYSVAQVGSVRITEGSTIERAIALMPLARVRGVVTDEQRKPVGGVSVVAGPERTFTAADGSFDIGLATPLLIVRKTGYAVTPHGPLTVEPGETKRGVAIVLPRGRAFRVKLLDPAGDGIADEPVIITRVAEDPMTPPVQLCSRDCITSSAGELTTRLVDGVYDIVAGGRRVPTVAARRYTLAAGSSTELTLRAPLGVKVSGRVVTGTGETAVSDETVMVVVRDAGQQTLSTRADPGGTFTLSNVPAGKVTLVAQRMLGNSPPVTGPEVEVTAPANDVVLQLPPVTLIRGRVLSKETREPVRDFSVWIRRYRGSGSTGYSQAFTTEDGSFAIDIAGAPSVDLTVTAPGHSASVLANVNAEERSEPLQVLLDRGGSIKGRVTKRSQPVIDAMIRVQSPTQMQFNMGRPVRTDANGEFIIDGLAPGEHTVHVMKPGHVAASKTLEVRAGDAAQLDIEMSEGRTVRGRVIDSEGRPVAEARVTPRGVANRMASPTFAQTDAEGSFTLEGLEEGPATIVAHKSGFMEGSADVDASQPAAITITLARGGTVRGRIIGLEPSELARVRIHAFSGPGRPADTQPDSTGNFALSGMRDGMAIVTASIDFPARRSQSKQVEVRNGTADPIELDFGQGFLVTGRVRRNGAAVPEAGVVFRKSGSMTEPGRAHTAPDGSYRLQIEAGTYDVMINIGQAAFDGGQVTVSSAMTRDFDVRGGTLTGRVVAAGSVTPLAGVTVRATRIGGGSPSPGVGGRVTPATMLVTDSEGKFHAGVVDAGRYRLHASGHRYASAQEEVEVRDDEVASVEIRLHEGETVRLRILDAMTQRPIDGAAVTVYDASKKIVESGLPFRQDDGAYRLSLLPGKYTARIWTSEHAPEMIDLLVPGPDAVAMMHRAGTVTLQGNRPGATRARLMDPATRKQIAMTGLSPGVFRQIRPGSYVIEVVDAKGAKLVERPVTVAAGQTVTVSID